MNKDKLNRRRSSKKLKKQVRRRHTSLLFLICGCLAVMVFAIRVSKIFPLDTNKYKYLNTPLTTADASNADSHSKSSIDEHSWCLILVNKWNYIPKDYDVELTQLSNGQSVDKRIYPSLQEMFDTARADNIYPIVASGYRTAEKQQSLLNEKISDYKAQGCSPEEAKNKAEEWVAVPGTSEHQLGLGVDINADGIHSTGDEVYKWLSQNSYKFGFIRRYPADKTDITGVINEPWHYRYVGLEAAEKIHKQGICLEEYLSKTDRKNN